MNLGVGERIGQWKQIEEFKETNIKMKNNGN